MKTPVLVIAGPTASGKTRLAVEIARRHRGEVISADSMQIYRGMDIGTAKPTMEERRGVPHHLLDIVDPAEPFSVADYVALAHRTAAEIAARGNLPILCGGTGLYIDSFIGNLTFFPETGGGAARAALQERYRREGGEALHRALRAVDPETAEKVHPNNAVRLVRALEVFEETGVPLSEWGRRARQTPSPYAPLFLGLRFADRAALYARIDARVDAMMAAGLETEARRLRERGAGATAAAAIGYKELFDFFDGECTREEAVERIQLHSRRYAKRQMTWFRRNDAIHWLEASRPGEEILHEAEKLMEISGMQWYTEKDKPRLCGDCLRTRGRSAVTARQKNGEKEEESTMMNLQDVFLNQVRKEKMPVTVFLMNGFQIKGVVRGFDSFIVVLESDGRQNMIYKHAISTLVPVRPISIMEASAQAGEQDGAAQQA